MAARRAACNALVALLAAAPAGAGEAELTRGPYLQAAHATGLIVRWRTAAPSDSRVIYGPGPLALSSEVVDEAETTEHAVALTGLAPHTRYYYAVGTTAAILAGGDEAHYFDTPTPPGVAEPTRVWVLGDSGMGDRNALAVRDAYYAELAGGAAPTDLILMLGDNAYPQGTDLDYQEHLFDIYASELRHAVVWATIGNHDLPDPADGSWPYYAIFDFPREGECGGTPSGTESYYAFDRGNVHFIVLDSMDVMTPGFGPTMLAWLKSDLTDVTEDWIIALWHHPPYSKGGHDSDDPFDSGGRLYWMRTNVVPLLEQYGVDLVLTGHSHSYERSYLIDGHYGYSSSFVEAMKVDGGNGDPEGASGAYLKPYRTSVPYVGSGDGAVYAVAGSASLLSEGKAIDLGGTEPNHPAMVVTSLTLGSLVLALDGNRLDATFLDSTGATGDRFTIFKGEATLPPLAEFTAAPRAAAAPATIHFEDLSLHVPSAWSWDFDDDGTAEADLPATDFEFTTPGLHAVRLAVSNSAGAGEVLKAAYICITEGVPGPVGGLVLGPGHAQLAWNPAPHAMAYDLVRGDLAAWVAGSPGAIEPVCLENDGADLEAEDGAAPPPGGLWFYVIGATNCAAEPGSYAEPGSFDPAERDALLRGVCASCPTGDDDDGDAVCLPGDNCPGVGNPQQLDGDGDGTGDACDACPADATKVDPGQCGCGATETDSDGDGTADCVDLCPGDPAKVAPGPCGCGALDTDSDGDGTADCVDLCPGDPAKVAPGPCGCGTPDTDTDADGTADCLDLCPGDPGKVAPGLCGCGTSDADGDADGTPDCLDLCPGDPGKIVPGKCGCGTRDTDSDADATPDCLDLCPHDPLKVVPGVCGCGLLDIDSDADGTPNCFDGCPYDPNKQAPGVCGCGTPDIDSDFDGVKDCNDGCPTDPQKTEPGECGCGAQECWLVVESGSSRDLESVSFPGGGAVGWVAGEEGTILRTTDGVHWLPQPSGTEVDLHMIHFPTDAVTGYAVGNGGRILRTINGGNSWTPLPSGTLAQLLGVYFIPGSGVGFAVGSSGTILRTVNGGDNWAPRDSGIQETLEAVVFPLGATVGYVVGQQGTILKTTDAGASWQPQTPPLPRDLEDLAFPAGNEIGYTVGESGAVFKTTNGGVAWVPQNAVTPQTLHGVSFPAGDQLGWAVGGAGIIRRTQNGGQSWVNENLATTSPLYDLQMRPDGTGWAVGYDGVILRRAID